MQHRLPYTNSSHRLLHVTFVRQRRPPNVITVRRCFLQTKDQTWSAGNLALQDSMRQRVPVRVVRGSTEKVKYAVQPLQYVHACSATAAVME